MGNLRFFSYGILTLLIVILGIWFVMAAASAPTVVHFENNITSVYDEGNFSINWTAGSPDVVNYSIYVYTGGTFFLKADNDSNTGYSFNNWTEANYTFIIEAVNSTSDNANSSNISLYVDRTAPVITLPVYTNGTAKKNTAQLTLNISLLDAGSGTTGSHCLIDVNGTSNQTIVSNNGWCNSTAINLTGTSDGNSTLNVYVNDTMNVFGLNNSYVVQVDTASPIASASCSPSSVSTGSSFPCTCSGSDATSGVSTSSGSSTSGTTSNTANTGSFTYTCSVIDHAGNSASSTATYVVEQAPGSSGSASSVPASTWTTHSITETLFEQGYTRELSVKNRIKVQIGTEDHFVGVISISGNQAIIEISSNPVQVTLAAGEDAKVDVTDDGFYDIYVLLNGITNNRADVTIQKIHEVVPEGGTGIETSGEIEGGLLEEGGISVWIWILIAIVVIAIVFWQTKKTKKK